MIVKEYIENLLKNTPEAKMVLYRSQEGDGDSALMEIHDFLIKYGDRSMGDSFHDDFCHKEGARNLNQYIKRLSK